MKSLAGSLVFVLILIVMACQNRDVEYKDFLWTYYEVTKPDTALVTKLIGSTRGHVNAYLRGLYYRDGYRIKSNSVFYAKGDSLFSKLIKDAPDLYYGYAGRGLMFTEKGMDYTEKSQDDLRQQNFDSALYFLKLAIRKEPGLAMLYFYVGKNEFYRYRTYQHSRDINLNAIYYLDTALQIRPGFYKAFLRSGEYLSEYTVIASANDLNGANNVAAETTVGGTRREGVVTFSAEMDKKLPKVHDRIKYLFRECLKIKRAPEVYISMANASRTYFVFSRIDFLDSATALQEKDSADLRTIRQKKSEIYYHDLKHYKTALANYKKWLGPQDSARHWVAKAWCLFHGDSLARSRAFSELRQRIADDNRHADQYYYALGMMNTQLHKYQAALSELFQAKASAILNGTHNGYIQIEIAKIYIAVNDKKRATEILSKIVEEYYNENDPFNGEIVWSAEQLLKFYKPKI